MGVGERGATTWGSGGIGGGVFSVWGGGVKRGVECGDDAGRVERVAWCDRFEAVVKGEGLVARRDAPSAAVAPNHDGGIGVGECGSVELRKIDEEFLQVDGREFAEFAGRRVHGLKCGGVGGELNESDAVGDVHSSMM